MKQFFENYGAVALGILALLVLIAMITPVGNIIKTSLQGTVQTFSTKMDGQVDTMTESMNAAFTNATGFTGYGNNKFYYNGKIPERLENAIFDGNSFVFPSGTINRIHFDANVILDGVYYWNGVNGLMFDIYKNGILILENKKDAGFATSLNTNDVFELKVKTVPSNIEVESYNVVYTTYEIIANEGLIDLENNNFHLRFNVIAHTK